MNIAEIFEQVHHVYHKVQVFLHDVTAHEKCTVVEISNRKRKLIASLNPFKPDFTLYSNRDVTMCIITLILVAMIDRRIFPLPFKIWLIFTLYLFYLLWLDWMRIPVVYKIPSRMSTALAKSKGVPEIVVNERRMYEDVPNISINQCTFQIHSVKVLETTTGPSDSTAVNINKINSDQESQAIFQIVISHPSKRWSVWRKYEEFYDTYIALHDKYVGSHQAIRYTKLHSLRKLKKLHKKDNYQGLASSSSVWSTGVIESTSAVDVRDDSKEFIEMPFLQKLQYEMISWLKVVQTDLVLGDDDLIAALLKFPSYEAALKLKALDERVDIPTSNSCNMTHHNFINAKHHADVVNGVDTAYYDNIQANHTANNKLPTAKITHTEIVLDNALPVIEEEVEETEVISADGTWKGTGSHNFQFLDIPPAHKALYADCSYNNSFKVRGLYYNSDKKKVDAGAPISRFIAEEVYRVDTAKYGDRLDHVARLGKVKRRVDVLTSLPDKPFVYVLNIQLPGTPPASCVFYFTIPIHSEEFKSKANTKVRKLFEQFIDIPYTPGVEGIEVVQHEPKPQIAVQVDDNKDKDDERFQDASDIPPQERKTSSDIEGMHTPERCASTDSIESEQHSPSVKNRKTLSPPQATATAAPAKPTVPTATTTPSQAKPVVTTPAATAKSWTSDIVWPAVGEPGILDRKSYQNLRFKLIPNMVEAPWVVQMAVPVTRPTPVILGQKIVLRYFRGPNYMETDMHVGSSNIANNIVGLCRVYAKAFVCNIGVVLQGENEDELPEKLLACATMVRTDLELDAGIDT